VLLVGGLPTILLMFCEEWAWRGYLVPRLLPTGLTFTLLFSGLLWGVWHAPQLVILYRSGVMDGPLLGAFFAYNVVFGVVLSWLRLASGTMWPAMIAHGFGNVFILHGSMLVIAAGSAADPLLYPGGTGGLVGLGTMAVFALLLLVFGGLRTRSFDSPQVRAGYERTGRSD
jgi:membrane protease YdiL (CAAX protease family)